MSVSEELSQEQCLHVNRLERKKRKEKSGFPILIREKKPLVRFICGTDTGTTSTLGTEPDNLDHAAALIFFADVELVYIVTNKTRLSEEPSVFRDTGYIVRAHSAQTSFVTSWIFFPSVFGLFKVNRVVRDRFFVCILGHRVSVGKNPERTGRTAGEGVDMFPPIKGPAAENGAATGSSRDGRHLHHIPGVPRVPMVQRFNLATGFVKTIDVVLHVHLVQRREDGQGSFSKALNALTELLVTRLVTPRLTFIIVVLKNVQQRPGDKDASAAKGNVTKGVDLPAGF